MIEAVPRKIPLYMQRQVTRHGKTVWYFRRRPEARVRIKALFGTPEFDVEYAAALAGERLPSSKAKSGSLAWLYERYRESSAWRDLSPATRRQRENIFEAVMAKSGHEPYAAIGRKSIEAAKDARRDTPAQARNFLDAMRGLFRWARQLELTRTDPTESVRNPTRKKSEGFKAWTDDDVAKYEAKWPAGTRQRVWLHVLLYVGCRRGDAVILGRQHIRNGALTFVTEKGRERIEVSLTIAPRLSATLAQGPCGDLAFICGERGRPLTKESFGNDFKAACVEAGIADKSAHGLRKLAASLWAERGATEHELMALFGWLTPQMAALYTRAARRKTLAINAQARLGTGDERAMPSPEYEVRAAELKAK